MKRSGSPRVLHVYLDEPGGGPVHVALLREILGDDVAWDEVRLDPRRLGASPAGWIQSCTAIFRQISTRRVLVHAHGVRAAAAALLPARLRRAKLVVTVHGFHSLRRTKGISAAAARMLNRLVLRSADRVLVLGDADHQAVIGLRLAKGARVFRTRPTYRARGRMDRRAARRLLGLPQREPVVLWLGRLAPEKDPGTFVRALQRLEGCRALGLIVGDGPLLAELRAENGGLDDRMRFVGWMEDPTAALAAADVFVSTSKWEAGVPMAALEAAATGSALVLSDCPGNRDAVATGIPAVLVPDGDLDVLAGAICRLLEDRALLRRLGRQTREAVAREFGSDRLRDDVLAAYREVVGTRRPHRDEARRGGRSDLPQR
jgi:glycosyltransferase involved in cell wall biosynthesis